MSEKLQLVTLTNNQSIAVYEVKNGSKEGVWEYVISTPETRNICNIPEIVGVDFQLGLEAAIARSMQHFPQLNFFDNVADSQCSVLTILRGGLNFPIKRALHTAFKFNKVRDSFLTSQRFQDDKGDWQIKDKTFCKLIIPRKATLFIGDIVATGSTLREALKRVLPVVTDLRNIVLFTIGCDRSRQVLEEIDTQAREMFPNYEKTLILYFEGKFHLAQEQTPVAIKNLGTDLLRYPFGPKDILAPEFELSQYQKMVFVLEACAIYDGGKRSSDQGHHYAETIDFWIKMRTLGQEHGWTLFKALKERWHEVEYASDFDHLVAIKKAVWPDKSLDFLKTLYKVYQSRWTADFVEMTNEPNSLIDLCDERIRDLRQIANS